MIYLDTSALIKLYIRENGSETVQRLIEQQHDALPIWELQEAELINAFWLKVFWSELEAKQAEEQIGHFDERRRSGQYFFPAIQRAELLAMFRRLSRESRNLGCRTMDVFHVACAVQLSPKSFVSFDHRQRALAHHAGLSVAPKDLDPNS